MLRSLIQTSTIYDHCKKLKSGASTPKIPASIDAQTQPTRGVSSYTQGRKLTRGLTSQSTTAEQDAVVDRLWEGVKTMHARKYYGGSRTTAQDPQGEAK
jgi:hypothetical protein